jgi:transcriptional regulator with XRE-family HTH domain
MGHKLLGMQLKTYLAAKSITLEEFARRIGAANAGVVHKYANNVRVPRPKYMAAIVRETEGAVQPNDFFQIDALAPTNGE